MLEETLKNFPGKTYKRVVEALRNARIIDIYSVENSEVVAVDLLTKLLYLGLPCRHFTDCYLQQIAAGQLTERDVAVGISYSGESKDTVDAVRAAKRSGACTVAVTNFKDSTIAKYADILICTSQDQHFYGNAIFTQEIRKGLLKLAHVSEDEYTAVLMQGSGTFGVESVLTSVIGSGDELLICANGAYGERMADIAGHAGIKHQVYNEHYNKVPNAQKIGEMLDADPAITHVSMVHSETTSGILNDIEAVGKVVKEKGRVFIVDAMSSFGGVDIPVKDWGIDFIISSANKCIQGVPGFSFIIARRDLLEASAGKARSLSLDLYDQWKTMEVDGKWRFTSPTHVVLAFAQAMKELEEEGGIEARSRRYTENNRLLIEKMAEMGIRPYIDSTHQGPIITTFFYPEECHFTFSQMYEYIKDRGYAIYPGKVTEAETFRIGNIGEIYPEDIEKVCAIIKEFLEEYNHEEN
ncbi:2-aminoethylphosphonate--pyruvate transaminase [Mediterraneibacter glycyrrhizinilyticus]|uniref:2-aminoethylphosphonate--pyruvate transaminase n=1 Tax=Mediterraneibacter glycyrrhizinilyticus TaxID=342942 RepID=UPI003A7F1552